MEVKSNKSKSDPSWWKSGIIYQIYPRSFCDSNGDGVGDINGITQKLDYFMDLGIDAIWLSPIYKSPMFDFGYDISDYCDIDPVFGTMKDFELLISEAHVLGIKVTMDLVMNHTSHLHPWFIESRSSKDNPKHDWYIWHDGKKGKVPNNWLSIFGGPGWEWDEGREQYYYHSFVKEQPDVNWRNPELRNAMLDMVRFWLDKGVDGFRLDVCNFYYKDEFLSSNPFGIDGPYPRPYDLQKHIYDRNRTETHDFLRNLRSLLDSYGERMLVGEVCVSERLGNPKLAASFYGSGKDELHLVFDFSHMNSKWSASEFYKRIYRWEKSIPKNAWPCHVLNNHDQPRSISRYGGGKDAEKRARVAAGMLLTSRGTPFIYNGEEIGMRDSRIPRGKIVDPIGKKYWPFNKGRDAERTPMQWSAEKDAGFTTGTPWLPVSKNYKIINVENELKDGKSLLSFYKNLISIRKRYQVLQQGKWVPVIDGEDDIIAYIRSDDVDDDKVLVILNFSNKNKSILITEKGPWSVLFSTSRSAKEIINKNEFAICPYEVTLFIMEKPMI